MVVNVSKTCIVYAIPFPSVSITNSKYDTTEVNLANIWCLQMTKYISVLGHQQVQRWLQHDLSQIHWQIIEKKYTVNLSQVE